MALSPDAEQPYRLRKFGAHGGKTIVDMGRDYWMNKTIEETALFQLP